MSTRPSLAGVVLLVLIVPPALADRRTARTWTFGVTQSGS